MERDAKLLIQQELKAARQQLLAATINSAVHSAERLVGEKVTADDHTRLSDEYLAGLRESLAKSGLSASSAGGAQ